MALFCKRADGWAADVIPFYWKADQIALPFSAILMTSRPSSR